MKAIRAPQTGNETRSLGSGLKPEETCSCNVLTTEAGLLSAQGLAKCMSPAFTHSLVANLGEDYSNNRNNEDPGLHIYTMSCTAEST